MSEDQRPDPDALLQQVEHAQQRAGRGRLKIFFGACPGVGKTYAMLAAAQRLREQGEDVVCGIVETHGRRETLALLGGLELLPTRDFQRGTSRMREFDLAAALARRPDVILVDELAHSNADGSMHPKRWQDVEDLLAAGINVHTTLNVQHLESVSHIVGSITGITVRETVADGIFTDADEVVLVDLPPEELLQRLRDGKVYLPTQAQRAAKNFFRRGNLLALRQLALRLTAERVDSEMRSYRQAEVGGAVWSASEAIVVCVGRRTGPDLVRAAARLAEALHARWHAVYVETPALSRLAEARRASILKVLQLARDLGAHTAVLSGPDPAAEVHAYARSHNLNRVVLGRQRDPARWRELASPSFVRQLARRAPDLDLVMVAPERAQPVSNQAPAGSDPDRRIAWEGYAKAFGVSALATLGGDVLVGHFELSNIVMLFLLGVAGVALRWGRGPAVLAAVLNVLGFDFFCVPPRFSFAVSDVQFLFTFCVMLGVGLLIGQLTASLRYQVLVANQRERRARDLYAMSRDLASALTVEQVVETGLREISSAFRARVMIFLLGADDRLDTTPLGQALEADADLARWCLEHGEAAGQGTDTLPALPLLYLPLKAPMRVRGVLVLRPERARAVQIPEQRRLLETFTAQIAIALERIHFVTVAQDTLLAMEAERLRNSVLASLSHDLRTPLTGLIGATDMLRMRLAAADPGGAAAQAESLARQARRVAKMVNDMLEMARLQSGRVTLRADWQSVEELVGAALHDLDQELLEKHPLRIELPEDLPLVRGDAELLQRVLLNLFDNALKYTAEGTEIGVSARADGDRLRVTVWDQGPGLPLGKEATVFEKFARGHEESAIPGVGLGLSICRAIVEAHGGSIAAANRAGGGAEFTFTLPLGRAPAVEPEPQGHE
jgi:two-component system sensor histidine kinase KdpD